MALLDLLFAKPIRMLVVCDGEGYLNITFGDPPDDDEYFSLSFFLQTFQRSLFPWAPYFAVTRAHRGIDPAHAEGVINQFRFDDHDLSQFDQIWLFGVATPDMGGFGELLTAAELDAVTAFMQGGGGVFATGDHENFGGRMCQRIPRVRSMRRWYFAGQTTPTQPGPNGERPAPPALGPHRIDTLRPAWGDPGPGTVWFDNQSDAVPIHVITHADPGVVSSGAWTNTEHHPLLRGRRGPILAFPDHMHEGEVVVPSDDEAERPLSVDAATGAPVPGSGDEYPAALLLPWAVQPGVVAWSRSGGYRTMTVPGPGHGGSPDIAIRRLYGVVGAYDGHWAGVGRVVVDSTFHHFIDINLTGDPIAPVGPFEPLTRFGFTATPAGHRVLEGMEDYYWNIAHWLMPGPSQWILFILGLFAARSVHPLDELVASGPYPHPPDRQLVERFGLVTIATLGRHHSPEVLAGLVAAGLPDEVRPVLDPYAPGTEEAAPVDDALVVLVGSVALELLHAFPTGSEGLDEQEVLEVAGQGIDAGLQLLADDARRQAARHSRLEEQIDQTLRDRRASR